MRRSLKTVGAIIVSSNEANDDQQWLRQGEKNEGIITSVDGIQSEKGNDGLSGARCAHGACAAAEDLTSSETAVIAALLALHLESLQLSLRKIKEKYGLSTLAVALSLVWKRVRHI